MARITQRELQHMAVAGSFRAEPILNSVAAADGQPLRVMGYTLHGPRRNKKVIEVGSDGLLDIAAIKLWLDGIAYATARLTAQDSQQTLRRD